ncbi:hypothetical protein COCNU_07G003690 [Cocos nucifera]|uniref:Uncharacterized protein n=1 Tax=Cocos nucifera TaxID=13894 RepID=A0A8K0IEY7_COCNU|nr:hypothetical protein COCNU_07G003690 [Cocos nucifera]
MSNASNKTLGRKSPSTRRSSLRRALSRSLPALCRDLPNPSKNPAGPDGGAASSGPERNHWCVPSPPQLYCGGAFLACACGDQIKVVDAVDASFRGTLEGDSEAVTALALSNDDRFFFFPAIPSLQIRVWNLSSLRCILSWKGHDGPMMGMAYHSSGGWALAPGV